MIENPFEKLLNAMSKKQFTWTHDCGKTWRGLFPQGKCPGCGKDLELKKVINSEERK